MPLKKVTKNLQMKKIEASYEKGLETTFRGFQTI